MKPFFFLQLLYGSQETKCNLKKLQRIASHIIKVHASGAAASSKNTEANEGENWLKRCGSSCLSCTLLYFLGFLCIIFFIYRYIEYCRATCKPRLSEKAAEMLQNKYVEIRQVHTGHFHTINWLSRILFLCSRCPATDSNPKLP